MTAPRRRRAGRLLVAVAALATSAVWGDAPVAAADRIDLTLVSQPLTVAPDTDTTFVLRTDTPIPDDATIVVQAYTRVERRGEIRQAIDDDELGNVVSGGRVEFEPAELVPLDGAYSLTLGIQTGRDDRTRLRLANPGLYPLTIEILQDDEPVASMLTFIERLGDTVPPAEVLGAVAVSVDAAPSLRADGSTTIDEGARTELVEMIELLESTTAPITASIRPELLDALDRSDDDADRALLDRLAAALSDSTIQPDTYVALDPSRSVAGDLGTEFDTQLRLGENAIRSALEISTARRTWWVREPVDTAGLALLRRFGFGQLLIGVNIRSDLPRGDGELGTPIANDDGVMPSLMGDLVVQNRLTRPTDDPVLTAHHIVADLMAMSIEAGARAEEAEEAAAPLGVMIDVSDLDQTGRAVFDAVMTLLPETGRIDIRDADAVIDALYAVTPPARLDRFTMNPPAPIGDAIEVATDVARLRAAISSTSSMLPTGTDDPARWSDLADVLPATNLSSAARDVYVQQLDGEIGEIRECITVRTSGEISLGGRVSEVPLTLLNSCPTPLTVRVRLSSPKLRLSQPDTVAEVVDRFPFEIPVEARTNGVFEVSVELLTPEGDPPAQLSRPVTFTVEASALTGLGQVISGALLVVLLTWWVQHGLKRRRQHRAAAAEQVVGGHPSAGGSGVAEAPPVVSSDAG